MFRPGTVSDRILRAVLTVAFLWFGLTKLLGAPSAVALYEAIGYGQWMRYVTGSVETLGAIGLWVPALIGLSGAVLAATMVAGTAAMIVLVGGFWGHLTMLLIGAAIVAVRHLGNP